MKNRKRILAMALAAAMVLTGLPTSSYAVHAEEQSETSMTVETAQKIWIPAGESYTFTSNQDINFTCDDNEGLLTTVVTPWSNEYYDCATCNTNINTSYPSANKITDTVDLSQWEFTFTSTETDGTYQVTSSTSTVGQYLWFEESDADIMHDAAGNITVTAGTAEGTFRLNTLSQYLLIWQHAFCTNTNPNNSANKADLTLFKKDESSASGVLRGYTAVSTIESEESYLIGCVIDDTTVILLTPNNNNAVDHSKKASKVLASVMITAADKVGVADISIDEAAYEVHVAKQFDDEILRTNAKANSYQYPTASDGKDGGADLAFTDNTNGHYKWHSRWTGTKNDDEVNSGQVSESNPIWIQTSLVDSQSATAPAVVEYLTYLGRGDTTNNHIKDYKISIANTYDEETGAIAEPTDADFKVIKTGTLDVPANESLITTQIIDLEGKFEATHIRLTATSVSNGNEFVTAERIKIYGSSEKSDYGEEHIHAVSFKDPIPSTCTGNGYENLTTCVECNTDFYSGTAVEPTGHLSMTHYDAVTATCSSAGQKEYWHCNDCNRDYADENGNVEITGSTYTPMLSTYQLTTGLTATASSTGEGTIDSILDGDPSSHWQSANYTNSEADHWVKVDLGGTQKITQVEYYARKYSDWAYSACVGNLKNFTVWYSNVDNPGDGDWIELTTAVVDLDTTGMGTATFQAVEAKHIKITTTDIPKTAYDKEGKRMTIGDLKIYAVNGDHAFDTWENANDEERECSYCHKTYTRILHSNMTATTGSAEADNSNHTEGPASYAIDDNTGTMWHSQYDSGGESGSTNINQSSQNYDAAWFQLKLNGLYEVSGLVYQPRSSGANGVITAYEIQSSVDGTNWTTVKTGTLNYGVNDSTRSESFIEFDTPVLASYIKLIPTAALTATNQTGSKFVSAAEINLLRESRTEIIDSVADFSQPLTYTFISETGQRLKEVTDQACGYGTVTVTNTDITTEGTVTGCTSTITFTPNQVLTGAASISLSIEKKQEDGSYTEAGAYTLKIYPANNVYYEETFASYTDGYGNSSKHGWTSETDSTLTNKADSQSLQVLKTGNNGIYGFDSAYAAESVGASNGTQMKSAAGNDTAAFTFTGTGIDVYMNGTGGSDPSGTAAIVVRQNAAQDPSQASQLVKLVIVDTNVAGAENGANTSQLNDITNAYHLVAASVKDLDHGNYTLGVVHTRSNQEATNDVTYPIYLDGFRVYGTLDSEDLYEVHGEKDPNYIKMREVLMDCISFSSEETGNTENTSAQEAADSIASQLSGEAALTGVTTAEVLKDLKDNGPKNELFLYPDQTLTFKLNAGLQNVQLGFRAVNGTVALEVKSKAAAAEGDGTILDGMPTSITSSMDMFYTIGDMNEATTITITNKGTGILSITDLKYFQTSAAAANVLLALEPSDMIPAAIALGYQLSDTEQGNGGQNGDSTAPAENPFTDVSESKYYYQQVLWAVEQGIASGTSDTTFAPTDQVKRAEAVTFLWRMAGCPTAQNRENPFRDVKESAYYYEAVLWAVEKGIVNGVSADTFAPNALCTREQTVTMLWRMKESPKAEAQTNPFKDVDTNKYYAQAVLWAVDQQITTGSSKDTFGVSNYCKRCEFVTFLYRMQ